MKLPFPFFQNNEKQESEYYLALLLTDEKIAAVILHESLGKARMIGRHEEFFPGTLEMMEFDELTNIIDKTISNAEQILPPDIETHKTVFGVKDSWVEPETKKITKENLAKLKKVCDALDLTPIGFMVVTEALSNFLQEEEGAPLSAILAEIGKKKVTLSLFRGGRVVERIDGHIEDSAAATVDKLLKHFTTAVLPARIIIYDSKDVEKLSQEFINHPWSKSLPFLHVPQITPLLAGTDAKAVVFGAATQMGLEVIGLELKEPKPAHAKILPEATEDVDADEEPKEDVAKKDETHEADADEEEKPTDKTETEAAGDTQISADNFGFVNDEDITKIQPQKIHHVVEEESFAQDSDSPSFKMNVHHDEIADDMADRESVRPSHARRSFFPAIHLPKFSLPFTGGGNKRFILPAIIIVALIALIGGLSYFYVYGMQAHIVLSVKPKMVDQSADVVFVGNGSNDFDKKIIAAKTVSASIDGSAEIDTTGKKDVGEKAKGKVTIYNNDDSSIKLTSGTTIKASNGLLFTLDKDVTISSASGDIFSGTKPGTVDVTVTAKDIGSDYNFPSGTKFAIGSNSNLAAKNDSAFSGGSKKQVQVVSKNDVAKLKAELPKSLEGKANDEINKKVSGDQTLIPLLITAGLTKTKFDNDVDDEAKKVKLTANVEFQGFTYDNNELNDFSKALLKEKYSQDISDKSIKNTIKDPIAKKDDQIAATLAIEAGLLPDIDTNDVISKVQDKSLGDAQSYLKELPQVADSQITFSPAIPLLPNLFPHLPKQITVEIKPE